MEPVEPNLLLIALGAVVVLVGAAVLAVEAVVNRPRRPRTGPASTELGAHPEPPAVAGLLADGFEVPTEAAAATVLDLGARRTIRLEQIGERVICRVPFPLDTNGLEPYERRVAKHLADLTVGGVVPAEALATGPDAVADRWWTAFRDEVVAHARSLGLVRRRWRRSRAGAATLAAFAAGGLLLLSVQGEGDREVRPTLPLVAVAAAAFGLGSAGLETLRSSRQRDTDAGLVAAARWLGVRRGIDGRGNLTEVPPGGVVMWGRHLGYAAALGLAPTAVAQLPLGEEDDRHAWSRASGAWRQVLVRYPRLRPGWGLSPWRAAGRGVLAGALAVGAILGARRVVDDPATVWPLGGEVPTPWIEGVALGVQVVAGLVLAWVAVRVLRGVADLFSHRTVEGVVLRRRARDLPGMNSLPVKILRWLGRSEHDTGSEPPAGRRWYVAVDPGRGERLEAWSVPESRYHTVHQGQKVRVQITPRLGHVRAITPVVDPAPAPDPTPAREVEPS